MGCKPSIESCGCQVDGSPRPEILVNPGKEEIAVEENAVEESVVEEMELKKLQLVESSQLSNQAAQSEIKR